MTSIPITGAGPSTPGASAVSYKDLVLSLGAKLYWSLDNVDGASDLSGNSKHGNGVGGISIGNNPGSPVNNGNPFSTAFDGTDDRIESTYACFAAGSARTFTGWAWRDATASTDALWGGSGSPTAYVRLLGGGNDVQFFTNSGIAGTTWAGAWPGISQWVFHALIFDDANDLEALYINGSLVSSIAEPDPYAATPGNFKIGARATSTDPFGGKMGHIAVFERALLDQEISDMYAARL